MKALIDRAEQLLSHWAFYKHTGREPIEFSGGYTGASVISKAIDAAPAFNPVGLNTKITHATATRSKGKSKAPMGGCASGRTEREQLRAVDIIVGTFSPLQQKFLLAVYLAPSAYGQTKRPTDAKLAAVFGIKASYASRIKGQLIEDVVRHLYAAPEKH